MDEFSVTTEFAEGMCRVVVSGELDLATVPALDEALTSAMERCPAELLVDLRGLTFIDSTGIRQLWRAWERSRADGCRLRLLRGGSAIQRSLAITGIEDELPFVDLDADERAA